MNNIGLTRHSRHHEGEEQERDRFFLLRNALNIIFMAGAVIGVGLYFFSDKTIGTFVILGAMVFKMAECCFRLMRR